MPTPKMNMDIFSFLAVWFNNLRKNVFKVEVINHPRTEDSNEVVKAVEGVSLPIVSAITGAVALIKRSIFKVEITNPSTLDNSDVTSALSSLEQAVRSMPHMPNEVRISNMPEAPKLVVPKEMYVKGSVEVSNFPKVQEVKGDLTLKEGPNILKGLQVVVDALNELKLETAHGLKGLGTTLVSSGGGQGAVKLTDGTRNVTITTSGEKKGLDVNVISGSTSGTEYTEGATDSSISGIAVMWEDTGDTLRVVSAAKPLPVTATLDTTGLATSAKQDTQITHLVTLAGAVSGTEVQVDVLTMPTVTVTATNLDVRDLTSTDVVTVTGGAGQTADVKITLDSESVAVTNAGLTALNGAISGTEVQVDVLTMPTVAVTGTFWQATQPVSNAGTFAVQIDAGAVTSLALLDDVVVAQGTALGITKVSLMGGSVTTAAPTFTTGQINQLSLTTSGALRVDLGATSANATPIVVDLGANNDVTVTSGAITETNSGAIKTAVELIDNAISGAGFNITQLGGAAVPIGAGLEATAIRVTLPTDGTGVVKLGAGTAGIGKLTANSGVDIGDVDVLSIAAGDNNIGNVDVVTLPALAAGTNAIGKLLPPDIDVTAHTNYARKYYTSAGAATDGIIWSPAAGKRWHVVTMYIQTSAAATVTLEDDKAAGDDPVWKGELAANSGAVLSFTEQYPMASGEDAADLLVTTSAGNIYITCVGYEI